MSEAQPGNSKPYDPLEPFRGMRDAYLDAMAKTMVETVNSEAYAQASGAMLDTSLTMSAPFREALEKSMLQVLQQLSLPSRQDFTVLAERFTNVEMRLDDVDAYLDAFESKLQSSLLPIVHQLVALTEAITALNRRVGAAETNRAQPATSARTKAAAISAKAKTARAVKGRTAAKRTPAAKPAPQARRTARKRA
jgi:hypothetical protein